ncbi:hypothetical protein [Cytobacillus oceanisediminis]|uniref:Uncharacterized protein n=1 Tax=Cytobacillus oceanisediminis 2691 TaxID=1196031 RepID=A0A160MAP4_9BACI|nr:hypothetical protein [Cytobacillus oceanisediminis]AND39614.1 hypothetical protein A361_10855 [Cytobacillus oceanisediminis 2691]
MALSITDADVYISANVLDIDDWMDADESRKQRLLNVANRTLVNRYSNYVIPDNAVYEFAARLSVLFNDTNKMQQYGVKQFSMKGISMAFDGKVSDDYSVFIPANVLTMIGEANGVVLSARRIGRSVR